MAWLREPEREPSAAMLLGSMTHEMLLEPSASTYVVEPAFGDCRKTENKARRDAWREENADRVAVDGGSMATAAGMVEAVRRHPLAGPLVNGPGESELSIFWTDADSGLDCKARLDRIDTKRGVVVDLKTTGDARPKAFAKSIADFRYHVQAAHYMAGCKAAGIDVKLWLFVVVEHEPPYAVSVYSLEPESERIGEDVRRRNMTTLVECMRSGEWPAYATKIEPIGLPPWAEE